MKRSGLLVAAQLVLISLLAGCTSEQPASGDESQAVGSDKDERGCIASAGYSWCQRTNQCERPWELAAQQSFENNPEQFKQYCAN